MTFPDFKTFKRRFFRNEQGEVVIFQPANPAVIGWVIFFSISYLFEPGSLQKGSELLARAFLFTWAYLEITQGVNYFRRCIGLLIMAAILVAFFR